MYYGENVVAGEKREYGHTEVSLQSHEGKSSHVNELFQGLGSKLEVFMSHADKLS